MNTQSAPWRLKTLLFSAVLGCGLLFGGCSADAISGAASDESAVQAEGKTANGYIGDHNGGCDVGEC